MSWKNLRIIHEDDGFGMRDDELREAYMEGCRRGYEKAMSEMRRGMGFREGGPAMGERGDFPYGPDYPAMGFRDEQPVRDDTAMGERRRRRSNGQWY